MRSSAKQQRWRPKSLDRGPAPPHTARAHEHTLGSARPKFRPNWLEQWCRCSSALFAPSQLRSRCCCSSQYVTCFELYRHVESTAGERSTQSSEWIIRRIWFFLKPIRLSVLDRCRRSVEWLRRPFLIHPICNQCYGEFLWRRKWIRVQFGSNRRALVSANWYSQLCSKIILKITY